MLKTVFGYLLLVLALSIGSASASNSYLLKQGYFEDAGNSLTFEEAKKEKFTPYDGWLSKGYKPSTYWIQLTIAPSDQDLVLRVRPAYVENIELFDPSTPYAERTIGSKYSPSNSSVKALNHNFSLRAEKQERQIYLKVKSVRTYVLNFEVMTLSEFLNAEQTTSLFFVAYAVFTLSLALWLLGVWISNRETVLGLFVIQQFTSFLYAIFLFGYARIFLDGYIDQSSINFITHLLVALYPLIAITANKFLFEEYSLKNSYQFIFNGAIGISIFIIVLLVTGNIGFALKLNAFQVIFIAILFWITSAFGTRADLVRNINLPINVLRIYYTFNLLVWAMVALPVLGVIDSNELTIHANFIYSALSGLVFCWMLQYRARSILKNQLLTSVALKKEIQNERLRRAEQSKLMSMLTHEIRTPLSVLRLVVDRKVAGSDLEDCANRAVSNIDSIIDKCIQLDRLDSNAIQISKTKFNFSFLLKSLIEDTRLEKRFLILDKVGADIETDEAILSIIISNLLGNAVKYSPADSSIDIYAEILANNYPARLQFSVQNLIGSMGTPDPALAFDKYYRSPSAFKVSGSGLGLFLVKELTHALGGEVKLSVKENFITFSVWIPI